MPPRKPRRGARRSARQTSSPSKGDRHRADIACRRFRESRQRHDRFGVTCEHFTGGWDGGGLCCRSPASVPIARQEALRHLALDIIGQAPARPGEEAGDVSIGLLLTRLDNGVKDAPQNAGLVGDGIAPGGGSLVAEVRDEIPVMCCVSHGSISIVFRVAIECCSSVVFAIPRNDGLQTMTSQPMIEYFSCISRCRRSMPCARSRPPRDI